MCSNVESPGNIRISNSTYDLLYDSFHFFQKQSLNIKGKERMVSYFVFNYETPE